jgi:tyrosyl-tRNA synthetase
MGKTAAGAVWLDAERTAPYEYFQYWINSDDRDIERFLALFTFLPMDEIRQVGHLQGAELNQAKTVLAYEATRLAHGPDEAANAHMKTVSNFGLREVSPRILPSSAIHESLSGTSAETPDTATRVSNPSETAETQPEIDSTIDADNLADGIPAFKLFHHVGLAKSGGAARRLIEQGGAYVNNRRLKEFDQLITADDLDENQVIVLRSGKKRYHRIKAVSGI